MKCQFCTLEVKEPICYQQGNEMVYVCEKCMPLGFKSFTSGRKIKQTNINYTCQKW